MLSYKVKGCGGNKVGCKEWKWTKPKPNFSYIFKILRQHGSSPSQRSFLSQKILIRSYTHL